MPQPQLKKLDFTIADVNDIYSGPVGVLWEMLMGEQIHVGGEQETRALAKNLPITKNTHILDICSALGGPARMLVQHYGCKVTGLDATQHMIDEALKRTTQTCLTNNISYKLGNALDIPFKSHTFDIVWGQDAWCYITDKDRLITEVYRVLKPHGLIAFTDWLQVGPMSEQEWSDLNSFMAFPYMETLNGCETILKKTGFTIQQKEDLSKDFTQHCHQYQTILRTKLKDQILKNYGEELFQAADQGLNLWVQAADQGKVGRGRIIAKKTL
ncbi:MAG: methyltransferase domain-containing protein [Candidatus Thermoplasmatota archaeon]|nr:methyltransferase domain-containing protein [Candidatus Thermoplasmatota archaeon]